MRGRPSTMCGASTVMLASGV
ncbi:MAG: hypothetical protein QOK49_3291, partial [Baekduia sp.]|nr:hypothetical protein [Baekduia sp.]